MIRRSIAVIQGVLLLILLIGCNSDDLGPEAPVPVIEYTITGTYPHDTAAYTECQIFTNDSLFESTGSPYYLPWCRSVFGPVDPATGRIMVMVELDKDEFFGEGI